MPVFRSFKSSPGFETDLSGFFSIGSFNQVFALSCRCEHDKAIAPRKWQGDFSAAKAKVVLIVALSCPQG